jgi:hypothetical protein
MLLFEVYVHKLFLCKSNLNKSHTVFDENVSIK